MQVTATPPLPMDQRRQELWVKAQAMEASFLAEMLRHAGFSSPSEGFDGGMGEEQFASFLRDGQAKVMAQAGGIGLAEKVFESLVAKERE